MKRIFSSKESLLSLILAFSITSCSDIKSNIVNPFANTSETKIVKTGTLAINISKLISSAKFGIKGNFNDNTITQLKIEVSATDIPETLIRNISWTGGSISQTVNIDIPQGKNRIVSVTGVTATGKPVSRLMGVVNIYANTTSTITLNQGTTLLARILNNILTSSSKAVVDKVDVEVLKRLIFNITGYRESDNTYFGVDPTKVDVFAISNRIISNDGYIDPNNTTDLKSILAFGNLKVYVKDKSGNPIIGNFNLAVNDITGNTPVKVGNYSTIAVDQGVWEISAKVYVNSLGSTINVPLNQNEERNLILNGGGILYAKQTVVVNGTQEQEINLTLNNLKVKEVQLFKDEKKLSSFETEINNPSNLDARVVYEDGSYSTDQVIWEISDSTVATITPDGIITGLKLGGTSLKVTSILNKDKYQSFSVYFKDPGLKPVVNSFTGGPTGTLTIYGRNFDDQVPLNNKIKINGYKADVIEVTTDYIKVTIPNGGAVGSGRITVENLNGITTSDNVFYGNPIVATAGQLVNTGTFIMGSLNAFQVAGIDSFLSEMNMVTKINNVFVGSNNYSNIADMNVLVSSLSSAQIKAIALYVGIDETKLTTDIRSAGAVTLKNFFYNYNIFTNPVISLPDLTLTSASFAPSYPANLTPATVTTVQKYMFDNIPSFNKDVNDSPINISGVPTSISITTECPTILDLYKKYELLARFFDGALPSTVSTLTLAVSVLDTTLATQPPQLLDLKNSINQYELKNGITQNVLYSIFYHALENINLADKANTPNTVTTLGMLVSKYANIRVPSSYSYDYTERQIKTLIDNLNTLPTPVVNITEISTPALLASSITDTGLRKISNFTGLNYDTIQADVNAIKTANLNSSKSSTETVIQFLSRTKYRLQNRIISFLENPSVVNVDQALSPATLVSSLNNAQLDWLSSQIGITKSDLLTKIANANFDSTFSASGKTVNDLFTFLKKGIPLLLLTTPTLVTVNSVLADQATLSYISQKTKISNAVLNLALPNIVGVNTIFNELNALKNYPSVNGAVYGPSEGPMVVVSVPQFTMDNAEVSNLDFKKFIDADGYNKREYWDDAGWNWKVNNSVYQPLYWNDSKYNQDNQPVVGVSWYEAYAYAKWVGKRLPTEAEWEFASKGVPSVTYPWNNMLYPWGNTSPSTTTNLANGFFGIDGSLDGFKYTAPVGSLPAGNTASGISNLSGNVMEWASDWYDYGYYGRNNDFVNPQGPVNGSFKVVRGGSWTHSGDELRSSYRDSYLKPESRNLNLGFRCVK